MKTNVRNQNETDPKKWVEQQKKKDIVKVVVAVGLGVVVAKLAGVIK